MTKTAAANNSRSLWWLFRTIAVAIWSLAMTVVLVDGDDSCKSLPDAICETGNLSKFCGWIKTLDLEDLLNDGSDSYTVFAPVDPSIYFINPELEDGDDDELRNLILFHLYDEGALLKKDLGCRSPNNLLQMVSGKETRTICDDDEEVPLYQKGGANSDPGVEIIATDDIVACNGVVHEIGRAHV